MSKRLCYERTGDGLLVSSLRLLACLAVLVTSQNSLGAEQTGGEVAADLKHNVVRITTLRADSSTGPGGFGFIVGERKGYLYIVTAKHVVLGRDPDNPIEQRYVRFFEHAQETAEYMGGAPHWDLALLKAAKPRDLVWQPHSMAPQGSSRRGSRVWFVGRESSWYVPTDAAAGTINRLRGNGLIDIDMPNVREGTSGAPVITRDGIAGMIVSLAVEALSIDAIRSAFGKNNVWEAHPWSLRAFPPCLERPTGLVHWWPGDGNTNDIVGGNHGIPHGAMDFVAGMVGEAFAFDGMDSYTVSAAKIDQSGSKSRTVSAWIYTDASTVALLCCPTPFSWGADAKGKSFGIFSAFGSWNFWANVDASENLDIRVNSAPKADWVHHAITYDSREVVYYIDGTSVARASRKLNTASTPIYMGRAFVRRGQPMDTPFKGMLDELQIYDHALSAEEVQNIYGTGRGGVCKA